MILYCNFTFSLQEDSKLDKKYRDIANDIILQIRKTLLNKMSKEELLDLNIWFEEENNNEMERTFKKRT